MTMEAITLCPVCNKKLETFHFDSASISELACCTNLKCKMFRIMINPFNMNLLILHNG